MAENRTHERLSRAAEAWLLYFAHPGRRVGASQPRYDPPVDELAAMFAAAELHGVLPATLSGVETMLQAGQEGCQQVIEDARSRVRGYTALGLLLSHHACRVMDDLHAAQLDATVVKGPTFAKRAYPAPWLRTFTDIDVLIAPRHRGKASEVLRALGFEPFIIDARAGRDYFEDKWFLAASTRVDVEVHADLVHSPKLRHAMSVGYRDAIAAGGGDPESADALLLVAAAHGAIGHQFERLQHIVDVAQLAAGAAGPIHVDRLRLVAERCGVAPALAASLDLAGRVFPDPATRDLARQFGHASLTSLARLLLTRRSVIRTHAPNRALGGWRRKIFRQLQRLGPRRASARVDDRGDQRAER